MITIKNRWTGAELHTHAGSILRAADLRYADLRGADLSGADLRAANLRAAILSYANLSNANLRAAILSYANLSNADLRYARLSYANLRGADLRAANLRESDLSAADLSGATMPDGRSWEAYRADHLAGLCDEPEVRAKAIAAWGGHRWTNCPMHAAHGVNAPTGIAMAAWVALYDAELLPEPEGR